MEQVRVDVLDQGHVILVDKWGSDERIIEAARMSTDKGFLGWERETHWVCAKCGYTLVNELDPSVGHVIYCRNQQHEKQLLDYEKKGSHPGDARLLRYLYEHKHMTPFEMSGMTIIVMAPIFVFREWHRHRTQSYNEMSARYTSLPDVNYYPTVERLMQDGGTNKQAQGMKKLSLSDANGFLHALRTSYTQAQNAYEIALMAGVPKELARLCLPVGRYSRMMASANLRNWLAFLTLRMDQAAQYEIRCFANAVGHLIETAFPRTWELFINGKEE